MLFQQCLVDVFGFLKKLSFSNNRWSPLAALVLRISHSGFLSRRPPSPGPSHFPLQFFNLSSPPPPPGPSHFPLRFFNLSIPPRPVLHISHSGFLTRRSPPPSPSHFPLQFFNLSVPILENPTRTKELSIPFISTTLPS